MYSETIPLLSIISDIIRMRKSLKKLLEKGKPYDLLLNYIISNYDDNNRYPLPKVKELSEKTTIPYPALKKQLQLLYSDIKELAENGDLFTIQKHSYVFEANYFDKSLTVKYNDLPNVPRIGEQVNLHCFNTTFNRYDFYVDSIINDYYDDEIITTIYLEVGRYNSFFQLKLDEAEFKDIYPINDLFMTKREQKKILLEKMKPYQNSLLGST